MNFATFSCSKSFRSREQRVTFNFINSMLVKAVIIVRVSGEGGELVADFCLLRNHTSVFILILINLPVRA